MVLASATWRRQLRQRLLLCLFGPGTNISLKRVARLQSNVNYEALRCVKRRFVQKDALRSAIATLVRTSRSCVRARER